MFRNPQMEALNATIRTCDDSVNLTRLLTAHYNRLSAAERDQFAVALIMEISAREALEKVNAVRQA
ncbi:hypothetical protein CUR85_13565 [Sulfitobacter faviae]|nr:hypothetical protein [Sulfitobacter faviae]